MHTIDPEIAAAVAQMRRRSRRRNLQQMLDKSVLLGSGGLAGGVALAVGGGEISAVTCAIVAVAVASSVLKGRGH